MLILQNQKLVQSRSTLESEDYILNSSGLAFSGLQAPAVPSRSQLSTKCACQIPRLTNLRGGTRGRKRVWASLGWRDGKRHRAGEAGSKYHRIQPHQLHGLCVMLPSPFALAGEFAQTLI